MIIKNKKIKKQGFIQGIISLIFSQVIIKILGLAYKLYLTNKEGFGDAGNAIYSSGFQIYGLLLTLSSIGVPNAVAKMVSEKLSIGDNKGANRVFKISLFTFSIIGFCSSLILFFCAKVISNTWLQIPEAEATLICLSPSIFFVSIISVIRGYFNGRQDMKATANSQSLEQLLKTFLTIILVEIVYFYNNKNTRLMAAGANLATTFATIGSFFYLYKYYLIRKKEINFEIKSSISKHKRTRFLSVIKNIIVVTIPMSLTSILISINKNVDSITVVRGLKNFLSESDSKIQYGILSGKIDALISLPLSFNLAFATALVPAVAGAVSNNNKNEVIKKISFSLLITILMGMPSTVGIFLFAKPILNLLFPNANSGELIFQIASISIIFTALSQTVNAALQGLGKIYVPAIALSIGVIFKIILNIVLVPISPDVFVLGGIRGAAFATVICHIIAFIISFLVLRKTINLKIDKYRFFIKPGIATCIMGFCSRYGYNLLQSIINVKMATIVSIIIAIIIYIFAIIILKIFNKNEILRFSLATKLYKLLGKIGI